MRTRYLVILLAAGIFSCKKDSDEISYPTAGLISYFNFDDNLSDRAGNTPDGVAVGAPSFVSGKRNKAISFNGTTQRVTFARKSFHSGNKISISMWFLKSDSSDIQPMVACNDFAAITSTSGMTTCGIILPLSPNDFVPAPFTLNQWTHIVATYDGADINVYVNGVLMASKANGNSIGDLNSDLTLAFHDMIYFKGSIDELLIYNRALTQAEVTQLFNI